MSGRLDLEKWQKVNMQSANMRIADMQICKEVGCDEDTKGE